MSRWIAITLASMALLGSVVAGGERVADSVAVSAVREPRAIEPAHAELDVGRLARQRASEAAPDLFASQSFAPPPPPPPPPAPAAKPEPPPAPVAPPLPYGYLGRMQGSERTLVYLSRNQEMLIAERGETLENTYRVDEISDSAVHFTYLPLGTRQTLNLSSQ